MKNFAKKIVAIFAILAVAASTFAGCNKKEETSAPMQYPFEVGAAADNSLSLDNPNADLDAEDPVADATEAPVTEIVTEAPADTGFNSVDFDEIAAFYQAAATKTATDEKHPAGNQTMVLVGDISGDGAIGTVLEVLNPIVADVLADNSTTTDYVPGANRGDLLGSDISDAYAYTEDGKTYVYIELKDQTDGPDCDGHEAGPVARGIGTLGSIDTALEELGAEINSGRDTVSLKYNQAYIECVINEDGYVESGTWHYVVDVNIGNAKAKISFISANLKNLKAQIEYTVVAG